MAWDTTSTICQSLYGALDDNEQFDRSSTDINNVAALRMQDLQFFNTAASNAVNQFNAGVLARELDLGLINTYALNYTPGNDSAAAQAAMVGIMTNADKTVEDLYDAITPIYQ
jgi:hypothetical protein